MEVGDRLVKGYCSIEDEMSQTETMEATVGMERNRPILELLRRCHYQDSVKRP